MTKYAGIGSRKTPANVCGYMRAKAREYADLGYTLRTGGADGADNAFLNGCRDANGHLELYLPWKGFNGHMAGFLPSKDAFELAAKYHPAWNNLTFGGRALHARNMHQVLGQLLNDPVDFIMCWTEDGGPSGGTGQALRLAADYKIRVINLFEDDVESIRTIL